MLWAARCAFTSAVCPSLSSRLACDTDQGPVKVDVRGGMGVCVSRGAAQGSGSAGCRAMQRACECGSDSAVHVCQPRLGRHVRGGFSGVLAGSPRRAKHSDARCRSLHRRARGGVATHAHARRPIAPQRSEAARGGVWTVWWRENEWAKLQGVAEWQGSAGGALMSPTQ